MNQKKAEKRRTVCIWALIILFLSMFGWFVSTSVTQDDGFDNEDIKIIGGKFQVECGDTTLQTNLPGRIDAHKGDNIVITKTLSPSDLCGNGILFYVQQSEVTAYIGNQIMVESDKNAELPYPFPPSSRWYFFRLPSGWEGQELRIEITPFFEEYATELPEVYSGSKAGFLFMIVKQALPSLLICVPLILVGGSALIIALLLRRRRLSGRIRGMALLAVAVGIWKLLESQITQLFTGNIPAAAFLLFSSLYLIPPLLTSFLMTYATVAKQWYMKALFWISSAAYVLIQILQVLGITYYIQLIWVVHILLILIIVGLIACYISGRRDENMESDIVVYKSAILFSMFMTMDIVGYYVDPMQDTGNYSLIGLLLALGYLGYNAVRQISLLQVQEATQKLYQELAFKDLMTGLGNRSAFEKEMKRLRETPDTDNMIFLMADVNNLKYINDTYGHDRGDDAIVSTAKILRQNFGEYCKCFRIGGDEFCIIGQDVKMQIFEKSCEKLEKHIVETGEDKEYPYNVAFGYEEKNGSTVDECLKQADSLMYKNKATVKKKQ